MIDHRDGSTHDHEFTFRFDRLHRILAMPFGIGPDTARVRISGGILDARFGPWRVTTPLANVAEVDRTGHYGLLRTAGPARLSIADGGLTFATNGQAGLCLRFVASVPGLEPTGFLRHRGLTVTVADINGLADAIGSPPVDQFRTAELGTTVCDGAGPGSR